MSLPLTGAGPSWGPVMQFNLDLATFTAAMAKRGGPGPFPAAPIVQGSLTDMSVQPDVLSFSRGTQVSGEWYDHIDPYQGTIVFWITPEWDGDDGLSHGIFDTGGSAGDTILFKNSSNNLELYVGGKNFSVDISGWAAGTTYCIVARWDQQNTLDGTNYTCISIDDSDTFGISTQPSVRSPSSSICIGNDTQYQRPANAILEGLTIYRRPLYDGTYGVDAGNGDEIAQIYDAGSGKDPTLVTGAWDVVFCMPTDASVGQLKTGTGEAWTMPHRMGNVLTDAFCETTWGSSVWSTKGTPSSGPQDIAAAAEQLFGVGGYQFTVDADAEGIEQSLSGLTAGENYVIRVIAHEDAANNIRVRVHDDTNGADITIFTFGSGSSKDVPGVAVFTWELPTNARNGVASDCTAMTISVEGTNAGQTVYVQQIEVYENLVDNPSLETGSGDPWIPDGWLNQNLDSGDSEAEAVMVHGGGGSIEFNTGASNEGIRTSNIFVSGGDFLSIGGWTYCGNGNIRIQDFYGYYENQHRTSGAGVFIIASLDTASWSHFRGVGRVSPGKSILAVYVRANSGATGDRFADDIYVFPLTAVSLTATPQPEVDATESGAITVTGRDTLTMPWGIMTATEGRLRFNWTPRHGAAELIAFEEENSRVQIFECRGDINNRLFIRAVSANAIQLFVESEGNVSNPVWDCTGEIVAGTTYQIEIRYDNSNCELLVDGVVKVTASPAGGISFATLPTTIDFGVRRDGDEQSDAAFSAP